MGAIAGADGYVSGARSGASCSCCTASTRAGMSACGPLLARALTGCPHHQCYASAPRLLLHGFGRHVPHEAPMCDRSQCRSLPCGASRTADILAAKPIWAALRAFSRQRW